MRLRNERTIPLKRLELQAISIERREAPPGARSAPGATLVAALQVSPVDGTAALVVNLSANPW